MLATVGKRSYRPFYLNNIFDDDFFPGFPANKGNMPAVNIKEDEKKFVLDLAVPGMEKKDLRIDINKDVLTISSEVKNESEEKNDGYKRKEFSYASFCRSFQIPENINKDKIEANYKDGILSVTLPKDEEEKSRLSRMIQIS